MLSPSEAPGKPARLVLTPGEPAGIGPDLVVQLNCSEHLSDLQLELIVAADPDLLQARAQLLGKQFQLREFNPADTSPKCGQLQILPVSMDCPCQPGVVEPGNAAYVIKTLETALDGCLDGQFDGLVTGPVHKAVINDAGLPFTGHTEWFADRIDRHIGLAEVVTAGTERELTRPVMMLVTEGLRVALVTTHLPLSQVCQTLTSELLLQVIRVLHRDLGRWFGIRAPRILVCGLNPHAGEGGHLGEEEIETIIPALVQLRGEGIDLTGPVPADTAFTPHHLAQTDVVLAMYHDQGLPVLKQIGFGASSNITLGLPVIRTSVDHGTALDLAGKGVADLGSLLTAIRYASAMAQNEAEAGDA